MMVAASFLLKPEGTALNDLLSEFVLNDLLLAFDLKLACDLVLLSPFFSSLLLHLSHFVLSFPFSCFPCSC